ncbi:glycosyltransferase family 4 protein [Chroococcidiopsis sp. CCNUC1]|uniref:glycosyltransferase family 4 protein n=1 Tax=Chroococcidiopsis sp. CCNUC1 TaxID=2653189 RepID=UPI0020226743|nr:glycosyltransferase family 4 protein [Chroococcidiopsis sp. CCNUC1]URD49406.1 glycosyltransferase family 4 protein [Chroococcidiopsis sp. CCNUC1]
MSNKSKMKLLILFPSRLRGGAEEYSLTIASAAVRQGWDVHAAFPKTEKTVSLITDFSKSGVQYHEATVDDVEAQKQKITWQFLWFLKTLILLLKVKPNFVLINLPLADLCLGSILACALLKKPTAVRFALIFPNQAFTNQRLKLYAWARARNQQWIAITECDRQIICQSFNVPETEIVQIYNGARTNLLSSHRSALEKTVEIRRQVRQELGLAETSQILLTVADLNPRKGHGDLIPIAPYLIKEFPNIRFVWAGGGQSKNLISRLQEYGIEDKVLLLGYRSDVPRLLQAADLFIFPTHSEGFPWALLEAMIYNLPIVSSNASGIPEIVKNNVHGLLCHPGDSYGFLENILWALRHPEQMQLMAQNARSRAQEFSEEKMVKRTLAALSRLSHT